MIGFCYYNQLSSDLIESYTKVEEVVNVNISVFLFIKALMIVFKKADQQEPLLLKDDIKWLRQFMLFGLIVILFWGIAIVLNLLFENPNLVYAYYPLRLSSSLLIYWIGYQGLIRYNVMKDRIALNQQLFNNPIIQTKLNLENGNSGFKNIHDYIIKSQSFLNPNLNLSTLADEIDISKGNLSKLINTHSEYNFSDYINQYRVNFAKEILLDPNYEQYTIVAIGLESGFNSKSTFYKAFKTFTGKSPSEYRQQQNTKS